MFIGWNERLARFVVGDDVAAGDVIEESTEGVVTGVGRVRRLCVPPRRSGRQEADARAFHIASQPVICRQRRSPDVT